MQKGKNKAEKGVCEKYILAYRLGEGISLGRREYGFWTDIETPAPTFSSCQYPARIGQASSSAATSSPRPRFFFTAVLVLFSTWSPF
jgi:hypothetical protein